MGSGLSISPICQEWEALMEAVRSALADTEAEADRDTPFGMSKSVWTSADMSTSASRLTSPETWSAPALRLTASVAPTESPAFDLGKVRTPAETAWKAE